MIDLNRKGMEMTIQTIVILVIALTLLLIILYFVINNIGGNLDILGGVGSNASEQLTEIEIPGI